MFINKIESAKKFVRNHPKTMTTIIATGLLTGAAISTYNLDEN